MDISKIDSNFSVKSAQAGGKFINITEAPFKIYGVFRDEKGYCRLPEDVAANTNSGVKELSRHTSGGIVRFKTNAKTLAVKAETPVNTGAMAHMTLLGSAGFSAYEGERFLASYMPSYPIGDMCVEKELAYEENSADSDGFHDITFYLPLYGAYKEIYLKVEENAKIIPSDGFGSQKPIVFYGSSITQGACASTTAMGYTNIVSRILGRYCLNLGFSGSARGEDAICEYMAGLEMSAFVLDYDHNAPSTEHLINTHEKVYRTIRRANPALPIIIASSIPCLTWNPHDQIKRREIIKKTYDNAVKSGDRNVYFLNGFDIFKDTPYSFCTVDGCHPNDLGMYLMAKAFGKILAEI